jgi:hypothetical protein
MRLKITPSYDQVESLKKCVSTKSGDPGVVYTDFEETLESLLRSAFVLGWRCARGEIPTNPGRKDA